MSVKTVCDLCGKDAIAGEFILPMYDDLIARNHGKVVLKIHAGIKPFKADLCLEHAILIANWVATFNKS